MVSLSALARSFINGYQGGFPVTGHPYARVAAELGATEDDLLALVGDLLRRGLLSRFGPIYDASRLGGHQTLAAVGVPDKDFDAVTTIVNALPEVAHNYRREHALNMWFVVSAASHAEVAQALARIAQQTGLTVYDFPKLHEFYLGLWLHLGEDGRVDTVPVPVVVHGDPHVMDALDYRIVTATQAGLPLASEPAKILASELEITPAELVERIQRMLAGGIIRRIGAVPNHYRLGLRGNGMSVWDVPDELAVELGERVGALDCVSHCYLRPRYPGVWNYNLFAMLHGHDRDEVLVKRERVAQLLAGHCRASDVLFSTAVLKKTGLRMPT